MVSELRCKEVEDHILASTMARVVRNGFKFLRNLATSIKNWILKIISKISKEVIDGSFLFDLSRTFKDDNIWVIYSGASKQMMVECSQIQTLYKGTFSHSIKIGDKKSYQVKGIGSTSLELDSSGSIHINNISYVSSLKKNLNFCFSSRG